MAQTKQGHATDAEHNHNPIKWPVTLPDTQQ